MAGTSLRMVAASTGMGHSKLDFEPKLPADAAALVARGASPVDALQLVADYYHGYIWNGRRPPYDIDYDAYLKAFDGGSYKPNVQWTRLGGDCGKGQFACFDGAMSEIARQPVSPQDAAIFGGGLSAQVAYAWYARAFCSYTTHAWCGKQYKTDIAPSGTYFESMLKELDDAVRGTPPTQVVFDDDCPAQGNATVSSEGVKVLRAAEVCKDCPALPAGGFKIRMPQGSAEGNSILASVLAGTLLLGVAYFALKGK